MKTNTTKNIKKLEKMIERVKKYNLTVGSMFHVWSLELRGMVKILKAIETDTVDETVNEILERFKEKI